MKTSMQRMTSIAVLSGALLISACAPTPTRQGTGEYIDDTAITTRVKTALLADPDVKGTAINVETYRGVVQLSGFVDSAVEIDKAVQKAAEVKGVNSVQNDLRIKPAR